MSRSTALIFIICVYIRQTIRESAWIVVGAVGARRPGYSDRAPPGNGGRGRVLLTRQLDRVRNDNMFDPGQGAAGAADGAHAAASQSKPRPNRERARSAGISPRPHMERRHVGFRSTMLVASALDNKLVTDISVPVSKLP